MNDELKQKSKKIGVEEAAEQLGVTPQFLRLALQQGRFSYFGEAVKFKRWSYYINAERLNEYLRKKEA